MTTKPPLTVDGLNSIIDGYHSFQVLNAAVKFDLFSILRASKGMTREAIAQRLKIAEQPARILLLGCVSLGLLRKEGDRYYNSDVASLMLTGTYLDVRPLVHFGQEVAYRSMSWFYESLVENTNVGLREFSGTSPTVYGRLATNAAAERTFHDMMSNVTKLVSTRFVQSVDLSKGGRLIDIGGGAGINAMALAAQWPKLAMTIFDLPTVVAIASKSIEASGLHGRIDTVAGDCFVDEFPKGDYVLFAHFLEIWSAEAIQELLNKAYRALGIGGEIFLINLVQHDDETGPATAVGVSAYFHALASGQGMAYTSKEYEQWLVSAGFGAIQRLPLTDAHGLVIGKKLA